jgi:hypothetical protein
LSVTVAVRETLFRVAVRVTVAPVEKEATV